MKTIYTLILMLLTSLTLWAQAPQKMSYQAVVRDASEILLVETTVGMQISILEGSPTGTAVYVETHTPTTNTNGLATLEVGDGTVGTGDFSTIDWGSDDFYIKSEIDPDGGTSYTIEGTSQLLSVPYALYAENGGSGNTLDQAYDKEMTTGPTPRVINADDGKVEIIATGNIGLEVTSDPDQIGVKLNATGAADLLDINASGGGDAIAILASGSGAAIGVTQSGTNIVMDILSSNANNLTPAVRINNEGKSHAIEINNLAATNDNAIFIENFSDDEAIHIDNTDSAGGGIVLLNEVGGDAVAITNEGGGKGVKLDQSGAGTAMEINSSVGSTGVGLDINYGMVVLGLESRNVGPAPALRVNAGAACVTTAAEINNAGTGKGIHVVNGNPANGSEVMKIEQGGAGTGLLVENGGPGRAAILTNIVPLNAADVLLASTAGVGNVGVFVSEDNNANFASTLVSNNMANGSAGEFLIMDEAVGKVNDKSIITALSNGMGPGLMVDISNAETGADSNSEPAIIASHKGFGNGAFLETDNSANTSSTLEIKNNGAGYGAHIDSFDNPGVNVESTLYVEQANPSTLSSFGRTAVFDLHPASSSADAAVVIRSGVMTFGHSALRVLAADPSKKAAVFSGSVDITTDLVVGGSFSAAAKAFKIDHPLDPTNKYLIHNSIESNERINMYSGNITTNEEGYATVQLPEYMNALNKDFKYQLTIVDKSFAQAIIWEEMNTETNSFVIKTNTSDITVSWQITGTRQDTWALENPMQVEVDKNSEF